MQPPVKPVPDPVGQDKEQATTGKLADEGKLTLSLDSDDVDSDDEIPGLEAIESDAEIPPGAVERYFAPPRLSGAAGRDSVGIVYLQKGEVYSALNSVYAFVPSHVVMSYDIACSFGRRPLHGNHADDAGRARKQKLQDFKFLGYLVPKFHNAAHTATCIRHAQLQYKRTVVPQLNSQRLRAMDNSPSAKNDNDADDFDRLMIFNLQREPEWMARVRDQFRKEEGPAPKACSWCRRKAGPDEKIFRCKNCFSGLPACRRCILVAHTEDPLHFPEEWVETHWKRVTLDSLGYVYQQGHDGLDCPTPAAETKMRVILALNGRHEVRFPLSEGLPRNLYNGPISFRTVSVSTSPPSPPQPLVALCPLAAPATMTFTTTRMLLKTRSRRIAQFTYPMTVHA
ncbi:hypothetical protein DFH06DRAFT_1136234 [Mycena polygramma]|nr:hypothetical protein DFH06DRAFT_1136234 [Mycena polygramma]